MHKYDDSMAPSGPVPFHRLSARLITEDHASSWVEKGRRLASPLLQYAGAVADPCHVVPQIAEKVEDRAYGNFMLAWLGSSSAPRVVHHLPDATFFLRLLRISYEPVFDKRPDLAHVLDNMTRPEMSLTNDVLQIQLRGLGDGAYSMIRHHALMLFYAALWLDEPDRASWMDMYDSIASYVFEGPAQAPSLDRLISVEKGAFSDYHLLAPRTISVPDAELLLTTPAELRHIIDFQIYAAAAIGPIWREYRTVPQSHRADWHEAQLSDRYLRPDFLHAEWLGCAQQ